MRVWHEACLLLIFINEKKCTTASLLTQILHSNMLLIYVPCISLFTSLLFCICIFPEHLTKACHCQIYYVYVFTPCHPQLALITATPHEQ